MANWEFFQVNMPTAKMCTATMKNISTTLPLHTVPSLTFCTRLAFAMSRLTILCWLVGFPEDYRMYETEWLTAFLDFCDENMLKGMKADGEDPAERLDVGSPQLRRFLPIGSSSDAVTIRPTSASTTTACVTAPPTAQIWLLAFTCAEVCAENLYICFAEPLVDGFRIIGNFRHSIHFSEGGYEHIAVKLFNEINVDTYYLEYDTERAGSFEALKHLPKNKSIVLGLITSKFPELENIDDLQKRVQEAAKIIASGSEETEEEAMKRICVSPQCG